MLIVLAAMLLCLHIAVAPEYTPIDELPHVDYAYKASHAQLVRRGDLVGQTAMREEACRGIDGPFALPPCNSPSFDATTFHGGGYSTAAADPPLYYVITGVLARLISASGLVGFVTAARLLGILWAALGIILIWMVMDELQVPRSQRVAPLALLVTTPIAFSTFAYVTSDAPALAAGAGLVWAVLRWERHAASWWLPVGITFVAGFIKFTNLIGAGVALVYLALRAGARWRRFGDESDRSGRESLGLGLAIGSAALAATLTWMAVVSATARAPQHVYPQHQIFVVKTLPAGGIADQFQALVTPVHNPYISRPFQQHAQTRRHITLFNWLLLGASIGCVLFAGSGIATLAGAALGVLVVGGPGFALATYVAQSELVPTPARYGLSGLPVLIAALAFGSSRTIVRRGVGAFALASVGYAGLRLITA